jgi:hypothetical protein
MVEAVFVGSSVVSIYLGLVAPLVIFASLWVIKLRSHSSAPRSHDEIPDG